PDARRARLPAVLPRGGSNVRTDLRSLSRHARAIDRDVGHKRVHRGGLHAGSPASAGQPILRIARALFCAAANRAQRCNAYQHSSALCSALAAGMWFLITERVLVGWLPERWQRVVGGSIAALIGATAFTVWAQSVVNEKVYTVSLLGLAVVSWLTVRWCDDPDGPEADRLLVMIAYLTGLGYANHMAGF